MRIGIYKGTSKACDVTHVSDNHNAGLVLWFEVYNLLWSK